MMTLAGREMVIEGHYKVSAYHSRNSILAQYYFVKCYGANIEGNVSATAVALLITRFIQYVIYCRRRLAYKIRQRRSV